MFAATARSRSACAAGRRWRPPHRQRRCHASGLTQKFFNASENCQGSSVSHNGWPVDASALKFGLCTSFENICKHAAAAERIHGSARKLQKQPHAALRRFPQHGVVPFSPSTNFVATCRWSDVHCPLIPKDENKFVESSRSLGQSIFKRRACPRWWLMMLVFKAPSNRVVFCVPCRHRRDFGLLHVT